MFKRTKVCTSLMLAFGGGLMLGALPARAQQVMERVEITGSSIKRIEAAEALPVTVLNRADIARTGAVNVEQLVSTLTSTSFVGSFNSAEGAGISTYGLASVSLRGLGSQRTLVLVNGRRLANFAADGTSVDVNAIPMSAVDRVEVLRDGASSVYGSDAIAGVINFILRSDYHGIETSAEVGSPTRSGGGQTYKAGIVAGWGVLDQDRYNFLVSLDVAKERALYGSQRNFANYSWTQDGLYSQSATPSGALRGPWVVGLPGNQQALSSLGNPLAPDNCAQNGSGFDPAFGTCRFNSSPLVDILPDTKRLNLSASAHFALDASTRVFGEAFYTKATIFTMQQPSPISAAFLLTDQAFAGSGVEQSLLLFPGNPNYPLAYLTSQGFDTTKPVSVSLRAFDNGRRLHTDENSQIHLAGGVEGTVRNWDYSIVASHNESKVSESTQGGYMSQLALVDVLNNTPNWDPYSQFQSPGIAAAMQATNYNGPMLDSKLSTDGIDGKITGSVGQLGGGPIGLALGTSLRKDKMDYQPSAAYQSGDISGYGGQQLPINRSRSSYGVFGEAEFPFLKSLTGNVSVRYDHYPSESSTNPKIGLRWQPMQQLLVRASAGTGFRIGSLPELYLPQVVGTSGTFNDPVTGTTGQFTTLTGGNPDLKPEKSRQASFGLIFEPSRDISAELDFFRVSVKDTIQNGGLAPAFVVQEAAAGNPAYTGFVTRDSANNITQISILNVNSGQTAVSGVDVDVKWRIARTSYGEVTTALDGTYIRQYDVTLADGTVQHSVGATTDENGNLLAIQNAFGGGIIFRWKQKLTVGLQNSKWGVSLTNNYQTGYGDNTNFNGDLPVKRVGGFSTWDMQANYIAMKNLKLTLGVKNLFDRNPPFAYTSGNYFQVGWDPTYYDSRARFVYVGVNYKFQ